MKNVSVRWKMIILALITLIGTLAIGVLAVNRMLVMEKGSESVLRTSIEEDYDENIRNQVDNAISMLDAVYAGYENGDYSYEEAETRGADLLRELRYGDGGYFWADTYDGDNVVLLGSETEGTNRMETKDAEGYQMVKEIIRVGQEPDGGYTDYVFPKEGETESSPKRSYSRAFEPFGWVVGTGNYIDYIDETVAKETQAMKENVKSALLAIIGMGSFLVVIVMAVCLYMAFSLSKSFQVALTYIGYITKGDFSQPLPVQLENRRDDFGILGERLENMKCQIRDLIREVKNESYVIGEVVDTVKTNVITLNGNIEDVSATTEELAASMEETAASSDTIKSMSLEIEEAAKNIANRSQDGAQQAADIHERASKAQNDTREQREHASRIHNEIRESLTKALEAAKVVQQIEVLSSAIMEITNQTNLLALNASIEAARAGEAGRGFAVVASQIQNLAEQSNTASGNIEKIVSTLIDNSEKVVDTMTQTQDIISRQNEHIDSTEHTVNGVINELETSITKIRSIEQKAKELEQARGEIIEAIDSLSVIAQQNVDGTAQTSAAITEMADSFQVIEDSTENLRSTADMLAQNISNFVLPDTEN